MFGIFLIAMGAALLTTVFALITNLLVSWRIEQSLGRQHLGGMEGHVVVVRPRVGGHPRARGAAGRGPGEVVVVERNEATGS